MIPLIRLHPSLMPRLGELARALAPFGSFRVQPDLDVTAPAPGWQSDSDLGDARRAILDAFVLGEPMPQVATPRADGRTLAWQALQRLPAKLRQRIEASPFGGRLRP